jgi:O-antigen/teichoic acid export membrane protein
MEWKANTCSLNESVFQVLTCRSLATCPGTGAGIFQFVASEMSDRNNTALELVVFSVFVAAMIFVVLGSLTFIGTECAQGTPILTLIFPCFPGG